MQEQLFFGTFQVEAIDPDNKTPFHRVSRVHFFPAASQGKLTVELDINIDLFPVSVPEKGNDQERKPQKAVHYFMKLVKWDKKIGHSVEELGIDTQGYEYVMAGMVFEVERDEAETRVYLSFGGLMMRIIGWPVLLPCFIPHQKQVPVLLMMRRVKK